MSTPEWASSKPNSSNPYSYPPKNPAPFASFMTQAVQRYGPTGSFWSLNPDIPRVPVRQWQIWNEQVAPWMWGPRPWQKTYVRMLKPAYRAIHNADSGAKVVAGSLVAYGDYTQWDGIRNLYKAGRQGRLRRDRRPPVHQLPDLGAPRWTTRWRSSAASAHG